MIECDVLGPTVKTFDLGQAQAEANRCLLCHDPPCSKGCPSGTDPGAFIRKLRLRNVTGAIRTIRTNNFLGGSCGLLCPTVRLCEQGCTAAGLDRPVAIGRIQHALVEEGWRTRFNPLAKHAERTERVAVLGGGPAGLSCAAELAQAGCRVVVFERMPEAGGQLRYGVPEHRYDPTVLQRELADIRALGVQIRCSSPVQGQAAAEALLHDGFDAVFIAPGLGDAVKATAGSTPHNVFTYARILEALRTSEAPTVAALMKDRRVAVVGGGSVAIDCAESAVRSGAREVWLVYRRNWLQMPATEEEKLAVLNAGVHLLMLHQPVEYVPDEAGNVRQIELVRTRLAAADASGRPSAQAVQGSEWLLDVDVVVEAVGQRASEEAARAWPSLDRRKDGCVAVHQETGATSVPGIFAGGDIARGPALIVEAVADGKKASAAIVAYLDSRRTAK